ncbi:MAG: radical SAM protein [Patescibacteria group bacterium]
MKKVLLISAGSGRKNLFGNANLPNLGLLYIASMLMHMGFDVEVIDLAIRSFTTREIVEKAKNCAYVGISCMTWTLDEANEIAKTIRTECPEVKLIVGGPGATSIPQYLIDTFDWVVVGEGELAVKAIVERRQAKGIVRSGRDLNWTGAIYPFRDPSIVPFLHMRDIWPLEIEEQMPTSIIGRRGCPFDCSFCESREAWGKNVVSREPAHVVNEIEYLVTQGYRSIDWDDLNINLNFRWLMSVCDEIIKRGLNKHVVMGGLYNPALSHADEIIPAMRAAGWCMLSIGVESPSVSERRRMNKQAYRGESDPNAIFELCTDNGIATRCLNVIGIPGQTVKDIEATAEWVKTCSATGFRCSSFTPFLASKSGSDPTIQAMVIDHDLRHWDTAHPVLDVGFDQLWARKYLMRAFFENAYLKNRRRMLQHFPEFEVGYRRMEKGFLAANSLIETENCLP